MKILVIRFSSIGDIVLTSPVIRCLKQQIPSSTIHYLTKSTFKDVLANNPYIDKIIAIEKDINEVKTLLQNEKYNVIVDLHKNIRTLKVKHWLNMANYITFDKLNLEKWIMVNLKWNLLPKKHLVDRYFEGLRSLNIKNDEKGLDFFIEEKDLNGKTEEINFKESYDVIVLGAAHFTKRMTENIIQSIIEKSKNKIILIGGKNEMNFGEQISRKNVLKVINMCGKCTIAQSASIIKNASMVFTSDTGMMHIAAALQKPITVYWGNTIPDFGMYPYYGKKSNQSFENKEIFINCRPCSKIGYDDCPRKHFNCMKKLIN